MNETRPPEGTDRCDLSRRDFVKAVGTASVAAVAPHFGTPRVPPAPAGPSPVSPTDGAVTRFFRSLKDDQRQHICFPSDHPRRSQVENNWAIVKPTIADMSREQQALCAEIFKSLCSEDGHERFSKQMRDDYGGFEKYRVAVFGEPGGDKPFEWVLTGRHVTLRADGRSADDTAFDGPIFCGHAAEGHVIRGPGHTDNVWWYQGQQAVKIFASLDETQRARALFPRRGTATARSNRLRGNEVGEVGLTVDELDPQQKQMVQQLLKDLTRPFRAFDVEAVQECLREGGGADRLRLTYFQKEDIIDERPHDIWKLEGPAFAWYYHGSPHVHSWAHIARPTAAQARGANRTI